MAEHTPCWFELPGAHQRAMAAFAVGCRGRTRIGADHLGHSKVSMTQDRYMSRGRVHSEVAALLDRAIKTNKRSDHKRRAANYRL